MFLQILENATRRRIFGKLVLVVAGLSCASLSASGQNKTSPPAPTASPTPAAKPSTEPLYRDYRGVTIDMSTEETRQKLGTPKSKGPKQDYYVFSDNESAQVFYRATKVFAISVDYRGENSGAPTALEVLGVELKPKKNGSMYKLVRYPSAGYWVSYNRTGGKSPTVTVSMQKIRR